MPPSLGPVAQLPFLALTSSRSVRAVRTGFSSSAGPAGLEENPGADHSRQRLANRTQNVPANIEFPGSHRHRPLGPPCAEGLTQILRGRDQQILNGHPDQVSPSSPFVTVVVGGIGESELTCPHFLGQPKGQESVSSRVTRRSAIYRKRPLKLWLSLTFWSLRFITIPRPLEPWQDWR